MMYTYHSTYSYSIFIWPNIRYNYRYSTE